MTLANDSIYNLLDFRLREQVILCRLFLPANLFVGFFDKVPIALDQSCTVKALEEQVAQG